MSVTPPEEFRRLLDAADRWEEERDALMWAVAESLPAYLDLAEAVGRLEHEERIVPRRRAWAEALAAVYAAHARVEGK